MSERAWTVEATGAEGVTRDVDVLERLADGLERFGGRGVAASLDTDEGRLAATFTVYADSEPEAVDAGLVAFFEALAAAGLPLHIGEAVTLRVLGRPGEPDLVDDLEGAAKVVIGRLAFEREIVPA